MMCVCVLLHHYLTKSVERRKGLFTFLLLSSLSLSSLLVASLRWGRPQQRPLGDIMEWVKGYANDWTTVDGSALPMSAVVRTVLLGL